MPSVSSSRHRPVLSIQVQPAEHWASGLPKQPAMHCPFNQMHSPLHQLAPLPWVQSAHVGALWLPQTTEELAAEGASDGAVVSAGVGGGGGVSAGVGAEEGAADVAEGAVHVPFNQMHSPLHQPAPWPWGQSAHVGAL